MIYLTKGDKILIVLVIILALSSLAYIRKQAFSQDEKYVSIQVDGEEIKQILFDKQLIDHEIPIESEFGYNLLELGDGKVRVTEASCPDQIDVKQGYISNVGETIVCLPNKLVIEIKGIEEDGEIDTMAN